MKIHIIIAISVVAFAIMAFETHPIDIDGVSRIAAPSGASIVTADSLIIEAALPRQIITFDLPLGFLDEDNLIMEALLTIKIAPASLTYTSDSAPINAYCVPVTSPVGPSVTWASISDAYNMEYGEFGVYNPDEGTLFFEISRMLYAATESDLDFYGVMIIPALESEGFIIPSVVDPVDFRVAYYPGAKETGD